MIRKRLLNIVFFLLLPGLLFGTNFGPWEGNNHTQTNTKRKQYRTVFNGFQGGAYFCISFFQVVISPQDGPSCRFSPVCSAYAKQAVARYGALVGSFLTGERLMRCNPSNPGGPDPVPKSLCCD